MNNITFDLDKKETQKGKFPNCWICNDQGIVFYNMRKDKVVYECGARCKCQAGQQSSENILTVRDDFAEHLAEANFNRFKKVYPDLVAELVG